jgi:hypothetical protein
VSRLYNYVVVFGTKPVDKSLDAYVNEGYKRIDHWPPTPQEIRRQSPDSQRYILWPKIKERSELRKYRDVYAKALDEIFIDGKWCVVLDEGLWLASSKGLNLAEEMSGLAYGAASNLVSMHLIVQRPANVPPITWTSCSQAFLFHLGKTDDVRELASLGTYTPREAQEAVKHLTGHRFLDLPCRGGYEWSISEVSKEYTK